MNIAEPENILMRIIICIHIQHTNYEVDQCLPSIGLRGVENIADMAA